MQEFLWQVSRNECTFDPFLRSLQVRVRRGIAKRSQHCHYLTFVVERVRYDVQNNKSRAL